MSQTILEQPTQKIPDPAQLDTLFSNIGGFEEPGISLRSLMPTRADLPLLVAGIGAASAAGIASYIVKYIPANLGGVDTLTVAELISGWVIYKLGGSYQPLLGAFGGGIIIQAVADQARRLGLYVKPTGGSPGNPYVRGWGKMVV